MWLPTFLLMRLSVRRVFAMLRKVTLEHNSLLFWASSTQPLADAARIMVCHLPMCCHLACCAGPCGHEHRSPHMQWPLRMVGLPSDPNGTLELCVHIQSEKNMCVSGEVLQKSLRLFCTYFALYIYKIMEGQKIEHTLNISKFHLTILSTKISCACVMPRVPFRASHIEVALYSRLTLPGPRFLLSLQTLLTLSNSWSRFPLIVSEIYTYIHTITVIVAYIPKCNLPMNC